MKPSALLDRLWLPFREDPRDRPRDMLYLAADRPPWSVSLNLGLQHAAVALMLSVYAVIVGESIGLTGDLLRDFVSLGMLIMGLGTLLNGLTTRMSAGHLLVYIPNPIAMTVFVAVVDALGPGAAVGGMLASAVMLLLLGRFLPVLRVLFPPEVTGVLLMLLGITLIPGGIERAAGTDGTSDVAHLGSVAVAAATLTAIVGMSVWSTGRARILALIVGVAVGLGVAAAVGLFGGDAWRLVASQPHLDYPGSHYRPPAPVWELAAILPLMLIALVTAVDTIGCGVTIDKMNQARWKRADLPMIGRLVSGLGLSQLCSGLSGTLATAISSANLGLAHVTGVAARRVALVAGLMLIAMAFLPRITAFIIAIPAPVVGAILIYTAAYMLVSGAELILSRLLDARRRATVGLSLVAGLAVLMLPGLTALVPPALAPILGSALVVGTLSAMVLNLTFRIGIAQSASCRLDGPHPGRQAMDFLNERGADWGARRDVIARAGLAAGEALELLLRAGLIAEPAQLRVRFDEHRLSLTLEYPGPPRCLDDAAPVDVAALLEADQDERAMDAAMARLSSVLIRGLADRVTTQPARAAGRGRLLLEFEH